MGSHSFLQVINGPGVEPRSLALQEDSLPSELLGMPSPYNSPITLRPPWTIQSTEFSRLEYWSGWPFPSPGTLPNSGIEPRSLALQVDSLPSDPQGKPKNTAVGSLSLLQHVFPTQESNQGLLHCRRILYKLRYQGSPRGAGKLRLKKEQTLKSGARSGVGNWFQAIQLQTCLLCLLNIKLLVSSPFRHL